MICLIAGNEDEAKTFASAQNLDSNEWFYPHNEDDLLRHYNFHVLVIGTAGQNIPPVWFERFYKLAKARAKVGRK